MQGNNLETVTE